MPTPSSIAVTTPSSAPLINSKGLNTSAVMGFCNTLNEVLQKMNATHVAVAFDHGKTFRHEMFPAYKAQREETPEDIRLSVPIIKDILAAYRIPVLQVDGFEADDVIGTVASHGASDGMDVFMLTPDKDYAQLVTDRIHILRPRHGGGYEDMGPQEVTEKYGLSDTSQVIDLLGLMGDSSDNYPGCPGVGEKTAAKLINEFGSIEGLLARTSEIKGKLREKVEGAVDDIIMSRKLATIRTDVPMDIDLDAMKVHEPDLDRLNFSTNWSSKPSPTNFSALQMPNRSQKRQKQKSLQKSKRMLIFSLHFLKNLKPRVQKVSNFQRERTNPSPFQKCKRLKLWKMHFNFCRKFLPMKKSILASKATKRAA